MKQKTLIKNSAYWIGVIAVGVVVGVSLQFVKAAWQEPSTTPPSNNLGAPINTGGVAQNKTGSLGTSGSFLAAGAIKGASVEGGKVKGTSQVCIGEDCRTAWPNSAKTPVETGLYGYCVGISPVPDYPEHSHDKVIEYKYPAKKRPYPHGGDGRFFNATVCDCEDEYDLVPIGFGQGPVDQKHVPPGISVAMYRYYTCMKK